MAKDFFSIIKPNTNIDFLRPAKLLGAISAIVVAISLGWIIFHGFNYGIDFSGGVEMRVLFPKEVTTNDVRKSMDELGLTKVDVVAFMIEGKNVLAIKAKGEPTAAAGEEGTQLPAVTHQIQEQLEKTFGKAQIELMSTDMVGARVGASLREKAMMAVVLSILGILVYLAWRFNVRYSPGAIVALMHDVIIVAGAFAITGREVSLTVVAALLTIAGYSVNDTIVIFDRIREGHTIYRGMPLAQMVNRCVNDTLSRTLLTNLTVLLVVLSMHLLGSDIIRDFTFAMLIGCFVGTYSTLYIASPIYIWLENLSLERRKSGRRR